MLQERRARRIRVESARFARVSLAGIATSGSRADVVHLPRRRGVSPFQNYGCVLECHILAWPAELYVLLPEPLECPTQ
jgi:hypothetical protein